GAAQDIGKLVASRWTNNALRLHGVAVPSTGKRGTVFTIDASTGEPDVIVEVDWLINPYGELLHRLENLHDGSSRFTRNAIIGTKAFYNYSRLLARSLQKLGEAIDADSAHALASTAKPTVQTNEHIDKSLSLDSIYFYIRIIADVLSMTIPAFV